MADEPVGGVAGAEPQTGPAGPDRPVVIPPPPGKTGEVVGESVASPAKVLRIGAMTKELLEEVRRAPLDEAGRARLREVYETSVRELGEGMSDELREELGRLSSPFTEGTPSEAELRVAQAQLVGWLEGLFHGIQAALFAQQMEVRNQLEEMRRRGLPSPGRPVPDRPGTYL